MDGKIYIGVVGAEYGTRAFLQAMDAKTGKRVWRFYTIPGPEGSGRRHLAEGHAGVPARRRLGLVDAVPSTRSSA